MSSERLWQAVAAALFVLWVFTFAFSYFSSRLTEWQYLSVLKNGLVTTMTQLSAQQQELQRRVITLEQQRQASPHEPKAQP
jgi:hypothetical protein